MNQLAFEIPVAGPEPWPSLPLSAWKDTYETLHLYTQIVGKLPLDCNPMVNEWWQVALQVTPRGLSTALMTCGDRSVSAELDFIDHQLVVRTSDAEVRSVPLFARPVADFYEEVVALLAAMKLDVHITGKPAEIPDAIPFAEDRIHRSYDPARVRRFFEVLRRVDRVLEVFRARFRGKSSPVQFWWGSFDLAVSRFSGRRAPPRPDADVIQRRAYDEELFSVGFWPGSGAIKDAAFYAYGAPAPPGFDRVPLTPPQAFFSKEMGEMILMYDDVRSATRPEEKILEFAESAYKGFAELAGWNIDDLALHVT